MARPKPSAARSRPSAKRSPARRRPARFSSGNKGFWRAFVVSSLVSFGTATYVMPAHWRVDEAIATVRQQWAFPAWLVRLAPDWLAAPAAAWPIGANQSSRAPLAAQTGPLAHTRFEGCPQFFPSAIMPAVPSRPQLRELCFDEFAILHSGQTRTPVFVAQRLSHASLQRARQNTRSDRFYAEARLPQAERAELSDYRGSGYSRGHMAPAADMASEQGMAQSFSLANMVPQDQTHNGGAWSRIEQDTRQYVMRAHGDVFVFTGPIYSGTAATIGTGVGVPDALYKLVYDPHTRRSWVHWHANDSATRAGAPISYEDLVTRTGMRLLPE